MSTNTGTTTNDAEALSLLRCNNSACPKKAGVNDDNDITALKLCSVCGSVRYCSAECQKADWTAGSGGGGGHKADCTRMAVSKLIAAIRSNNIDAGRHLAKTKRVLNGKVNSDVINAHGQIETLTKWSALHDCVREQNTEMIEMLLAHDECNVDIHDMDGDTPLFIASSARKVKIVTALLSAGANPNAKAKDGWTCVMMSTRSGDYEVTKALLEAGANLYGGRDMFGRTAIDMVSSMIRGDVGMTVIEGETLEEARTRYVRTYSLFSQYAHGHDD